MDFHSMRRKKSFLAKVSSGFSHIKGSSVETSLIIERNANVKRQQYKCLVTPWLIWLSRLEHRPLHQKLVVRSQVRAPTQIVSPIPTWGACGRQPVNVFYSLPFSLLLSEIIRKLFAHLDNTTFQGYKLRFLNREKRKVRALFVAHNKIVSDTKLSLQIKSVISQWVLKYQQVFIIQKPSFFINTQHARHISQCYFMKVLNGLLHKEKKNLCISNECV